MDQYGVVLFHTTSAVLQAEKLLNKKGYSTKLIPTPRQFSSDCGVALRFDWNYRAQIQLELDEANVEVDNIYLLDT